MQQRSNIRLCMSPAIRIARIARTRTRIGTVGVLRHSANQYPEARRRPRTAIRLECGRAIRRAACRPLTKPPAARIRSDTVAGLRSAVRDEVGTDARNKATRSWREPFTLGRRP